MSTAPRILVTGAGGRLGRVAAPAFADAGWQVVALDRATLDITDRAAVFDVARAQRPDAVLNLAAWTSLARCEADPATAASINTHGVQNVADACAEVGAHLCHISSDYVFGHEAQPGGYREDHATAPLSVYGTSKRDGELAAGDGATVVRTSWLAGAHAPNVVWAVLTQAADSARELRFVDDQRGSPTATDDLVSMLLLLVTERLSGLFHVTNQGSATWFDIASHVLSVAGQDPARVQPVPGREIEPALAPLRPPFSVLDNAALRARGIPLLPDWRESYAALVHRITDDRLPLASGSRQD